MLIFSGQSKTDGGILLWRTPMNKNVVFHRKCLIIYERYLRLKLWSIKLSLIWYFCKTSFPILSFSGLHFEIQTLNHCLCPFSVAITEYYRLSNLQRKVYLSYGSGGYEVQEHGISTWQRHEKASYGESTWNRESLLLYQSHSCNS